jgi:hypothetical protein
MASIATPAFAAGLKVYVGNFKDNTVSVIDTTTREPLLRRCQWQRGRTGLP